MNDENDEPEYNDNAGYVDIRITFGTEIDDAQTASWVESIERTGADTGTMTSAMLSYAILDWFEYPRDLAIELSNTIKGLGTNA